MESGGHIFKVSHGLSERNKHRHGRSSLHQGRHGTDMTAINLIGMLSHYFPAATFDIEMMDCRWRCIATDRTSQFNSLTIEPLTEDTLTVQGCSFGLCVEVFVMGKDNWEDVARLIEGRYLEVGLEVDAKEV